MKPDGSKPGTISSISTVPSSIYGTQQAARNEYRFVYQGRPIDAPLPWDNEADLVCAVSFWLPTEFLEEHGPGRVRELAMELAEPPPLLLGPCGSRLQLRDGCDGNSA